MSAGSKLEAALVANAVKLSQNAAAILPATWNLVQVEFAATNFSTLSAAAAPSMHKFLQHSTSLPVQSAMPLLGPEPDKEIESEIPKAAIPHSLPDKCLTEHSKGNLDVARTSEAAANANEVQHVRTRSDSADCLIEPITLADVDVNQQCQMLREFEERQALQSRQKATNQSGLKRTHTGHIKQAGKTSKLVHDTGQRTITSLFRKG